MKTRFFVTIVVILVFVFATGAVIANASLSDTQEDQPQVTEKTYVLTVSTTAPIVELPEETRTYFDIPLSHDVQDHLIAECEKHNISPTIVIAMIDRESRFNTYALGDNGKSAGLMQIQAKWHLKRMINLESTDLFDPIQNITVGVDILAEQLNRYGGDMRKALTAYNRGSYQGTITNYAKEILKNAAEVKQLDD